MKTVRAVVMVLTAATVLAGCTLFEDREPEPVMTQIPNEPSAGAELLCGMDRVSVETAVGYPIVRVEGSLDDDNGCLMWPPEGSLPRSWVLSAIVVDVESEDARQWRGTMDGTLEGTVLPDVPYTTVDGGVWLSVVATVSVAFAGDHVISLIVESVPEDRDPAADLLALSHQLAASRGLTLDPARG